MLWQFSKLFKHQIYTMSRKWRPIKLSLFSINKFPTTLHALALYLHYSDYFDHNLFSKLFYNTIKQFKQLLCIFHTIRCINGSNETISYWLLTKTIDETPIFSMFLFYSQCRMLSSFLLLRSKLSSHASLELSIIDHYVQLNAIYWNMMDCSNMN